MDLRIYLICSLNVIVPASSCFLNIQYMHVTFKYSLGWQLVMMPETMTILLGFIKESITKIFVNGF